MKELEIGSGKFKGYYRSDKSIVFKNRPTAEWEYMACGTGRTGLAILAHDHIILQINHEGAINEQGYLVPVCRIHIEYPDDPFSTAEQYNGFTMVHDLKNAVITLTATVSDGTVTVEIRACMQTDMIRVDIMDTRINPTDMTLWVEVPWPGTCGSFFPGEFHMWHDNGKITSWHDINIASGLSDDSAFTDVLKDRCFGFSIKTEECIAWDGNHIVLDKNKKKNFSVYATACCNRELFLSLIEDKTKLSVFEQEFISRHNDYWDTFWKRMYFETDEQTMLPFLAAYDLYRYLCSFFGRKQGVSLKISNRPVKIHFSF